MQRVCGVEESLAWKAGGGLGRSMGAQVEARPRLEQRGQGRRSLQRALHGKGRSGQGGGSRIEERIRWVRRVAERQMCSRLGTT